MRVQSRANALARAAALADTNGAPAAVLREVFANGRTNYVAVPASYAQADTERAARIEAIVTVTR